MPVRVVREYGRGTDIRNPIDIHVGKRIRAYRTLLGMNQEALARALGLSFQQVQKYEHGTNQVSASRLSEIAEILNAPISYFFGDFQSTVGAEDKEWREQLEQPESIQLIRLYYEISDPTVRHQFLEMIKVAATSTPAAQ